MHVCVQEGGSLVWETTKMMDLSTSLLFLGCIFLGGGGVSVFNGFANVQHTDLKIPLFGRGGISEI